MKYLILITKLMILYMFLIIALRAVKTSSKWNKLIAKISCWWKTTLRTPIRRLRRRVKNYFFTNLPPKGDRRWGKAIGYTIRSKIRNSVYMGSLPVFMKRWILLRTPIWENTLILKRWGIKLPQAYIVNPFGIPMEYAHKFQHVRRSTVFLAYKIKRLEKLSKTNPKLYWKEAELLARTSEAFQTSALTKVKPRWYLSMEWREVNKLMRDVKKAINNRETKVKMRRIYIPKKDPSKTRSLGIPSVKWRMITGMYSTLIQIYMSPRLSPNQYGGRPNMSPLDAWIDLITGALRHKDIYEYDLKNFFHNVSIRLVNNYMKEVGISEDVIKWIYQCNRSYPKPFKATIKDPETGEIHKETFIHDTDWELAGQDEILIEYKGKEFHAEINGRGEFIRKRYNKVPESRMKREGGKYGYTRTKRLLRVPSPLGNSRLMADENALKQKGTWWNVEQRNSELYKFKGERKVRSGGEGDMIWGGPRKLSFDSSTILTGYPQGLAWSPILSMMSLEAGKRLDGPEGIRMVQFVDDGLMSGNFAKEENGETIMKEERCPQEEGPAKIIKYPRDLPIKKPLYLEFDSGTRMRRDSPIGWPGTKTLPLSDKPDTCRLIKEGGQWLVSKWKYLGVTVTIDEFNKVTLEGQQGNTINSEDAYEIASRCQNSELRRQGHPETWGEKKAREELNQYLTLKGNYSQKDETRTTIWNVGGRSVYYHLVKYGCVSKPWNELVAILTLISGYGWLQVLPSPYYSNPLNYLMHGVVIFTTWHMITYREKWLWRGPYASLTLDKADQVELGLQIKWWALAGLQKIPRGWLTLALSKWGPDITTDIKWRPPDPKPKYGTQNNPATFSQFGESVVIEPYRPSGPIGFVSTYFTGIWLGRRSIRSPWGRGEDKTEKINGKSNDTNKSKIRRVTYLPKWQLPMKSERRTLQATRLAHKTYRQFLRQLEVCEGNENFTERQFIRDLLSVSTWQGLTTMYPNRYEGLDSDLIREAHHLIHNLDDDEAGPLPPTAQQETQEES